MMTRAFFSRCWLGTVLICLATSSMAAEVMANREDSAPQGFYATRVAYAVLVDDEEMLQQDLRMRTRPNWLERGIAGVFIGPVAGLEAVTWPFVTLFASVEDANHAPSRPEYLPETRGLSH